MDKIEKIRSGTLAIIEAGMARNTHPPMPAAVADAVAFIQTADDDVLEVNFHQFAGGPKKNRCIQTSMSSTAWKSSRRLLP